MTRAIPNAYDNLLVYYFSGTGNARKTAEWIVAVGKNAGMNTRLVNLDRSREIRLPEFPAGKTLVGFCYPTHGFMVPPIMERYIRKLPAKCTRDAFLMNTRAGMKVGRLFMPGISGLALIWPALMLKWKGYGVIAMCPVDLPSNWISLHPGLRQKVVRSIFERWHKKVTGVALKMIRGQSLYPALYTLPVDLAISPVSVGYFFVGRFNLAKMFISTNDCNGCGVCEKRCPNHAIRMIGDRPYWTFKCESCMRCMNICPKRAIETPHSFAIVMVYLVWSLIPASLLAWMVREGLPGMDNPLLFELAWWILAIAGSFFLFYVGYRLLHFLMRYRIVNRFISITSLTHYRFWRRYRIPEDY